MTAADPIRERVALATPPKEGTPMSPVTWRGPVAVVADGGKLVDVDCTAFLSTVAPVDLIARVERMDLVTDAGGQRGVTMVIDDTGRAVMSTGFNERPYGDVAVSMDGVVFSLGMVQYHADESEDARLNLHFEQPADLAQAA
jgi:hypothetical protein